MLGPVLHKMSMQVMQGIASSIAQRERNAQKCFNPYTSAIALA